MVRRPEARISYTQSSTKFSPKTAVSHHRRHAADVQLCQGELYVASERSYRCSNSCAISGVHTEDPPRNSKVNGGVRSDQPWKQSKSCRNLQSPKLESPTNPNQQKVCESLKGSLKNSGHQQAKRVRTSSC